MLRTGPRDIKVSQEISALSSDSDFELKGDQENRMAGKSGSESGQTDADAGNVLPSEETIQQTAKSKLARLQPLYDILNEQFVANWIPERDLVIDETMSAYKGAKSGFLQCMPMKPVKRGYKSYTIVSKASYLLHIKLFIGKNDSGESKKDSMSQVVLDLVSKLPRASYRLVFDSAYTSVRLLHQLKELGIDACGSIRLNRALIPRRFVEEVKSLGPGQSTFVVSKSLHVALHAFKDKKAITIASNFHEPLSMVHSNDQVVPEALRDYRENMGFVDIFNHLASYSPTSRKTFRWWHPLYFQLFDASITNAIVLYRMKFPNGPYYDEGPFRRKLIDQLLTVARHLRELHKDDKPDFDRHLDSKEAHPLQEHDPGASKAEIKLAASHSCVIGPDFDSITVPTPFDSSTAWACYLSILNRPKRKSEAPSNEVKYSTSMMDIVSDEKGSPSKPFNYQSLGQEEWQEILEHKYDDYPDVMPESSPGDSANDEKQISSVHSVDDVHPRISQDSTSSQPISGKNLSEKKPSSKALHLLQRATCEEGKPKRGSCQVKKCKNRPYNVCSVCQVFLCWKCFPLYHNDSKMRKK